MIRCIDGAIDDRVRLHLTPLKAAFFAINFDLQRVFFTGTDLTGNKYTGDAIVGFDQRCAIIEGSVMIAERFGVHTVAEGVETLEQARLLHAIGVTYLQGYLFGKPVEHFAEVTVDSDFLIWSQDKQSKAS